MAFNPGDVLLEKLTIKNYRGQEVDLIGIYASIEIFEDIFNASISAKLVVADAVDLFQCLPVVGQETVNIVYRTHDSLKKVNLTMMTFDIPIKVNLKDNVAGFSLDLMPLDAIIARTSYSTTSLSGNIGECVKSVLTDTIGTTRPITIDKISNSIVYNPTRQKPFEIINTLCNRATTTSSNDVADVMFYDTVDGYQCNSMTTLMTKASVDTYKIGMLNMLSNVTDATEDFYKIGNYIVKESGTSMGSLLGGSIGGTVGVFDIITRTYKENKFNIIDDKAKLSFVSPELSYSLDHDLIKRATDSHFKMVLAGTKDHSLLMRTAKLDQMFNGTRLIADLAGNSDLRVGQCIDVEIPSASPQDQTKQKSERFLSGKYLIASLKHVIGSSNRGAYRTVVELVTDSNNTKLDDSIKLFDRIQRGTV